MLETIILLLSYFILFYHIAHIILWISGYDIEEDKYYRN